MNGVAVVNSLTKERRDQSRRMFVPLSKAKAIDSLLFTGSPVQDWPHHLAFRDCRNIVALQMEAIMRYSTLYTGGQCYTYQ